MVAGTERYFQIARCFRDEDQRGDRQPEFTQLDIEMSFVERDDVMQLLEGVYSLLVEELFPDRPVLTEPWPRLTYQESMDRFGSDRPDLRFGLELKDISDLAAGQRLQGLRVGSRRWRRSAGHQLRWLRRVQSPRNR